MLLMKLRKITSHPLLTRHQYDETLLQEICAELKRNDPKPWEKFSIADMVNDFSFMSDFQLHQMCMDHACTEPYKLKQGKSLCPSSSSPPEHIMQSGKMAVLTDLLAKLKSGNHRILLFSQMTQYVRFTLSTLIPQSARHSRTLFASAGISLLAS